uniref:Uncharacterized protein n=1 Tax=Clastoptera arizonana TaxID=38151 RepID=A0A1B6E5K2_9HEMI
MTIIRKTNCILSLKIIFILSTLPMYLVGYYMDPIWKKILTPMDIQVLDKEAIRVEKKAVEVFSRTNTAPETKYKVIYRVMKEETKVLRVLRMLLIENNCKDSDSYFIVKKTLKAIKELKKFKKVTERIENKISRTVDILRKIKEARYVLNDDGYFDEEFDLTQLIRATNM